MELSSRPAYRPDIDGLRAVAVLAVLCFHAFPGWLDGGFVGVDVFFVISGYLISTIILGELQRGSFSYRAFYSRRIKRIFPALILVLVTSYALGWHALPAPDYRQLGKHIAAGAGFAANLALWLESGYFDAASQTKPLLHLWSLGVEEQFYIAWPLLLGLAWRRRWSLQRGVLVAGGASFALNVSLVGADPAATFYSPLARLWELIVGGILAHLTLHAPERVPRFPGQSTIGLVLIAASALWLDEGALFPGWWALLPTLGAFMTIGAGPGAWPNRHLLSSRPFVWIGLISYPLYLWHWPLLAFLRIVEGEAPPLALRAAVVAASFASAWLTYELVERRVREGGANCDRGLLTVLVGAMVAVCLVGALTYERGGLIFRAVNRSFVSGGAYDWEAGYRHGQCFLDSGIGFAEACSGRAGEAAHRPLVLLWGDSHAASLYRGLWRQRHAFAFALAQYTTGGCPPVLDFAPGRNAPGCTETNEYVLRKVEELHPHTVVLGAHWARYDGRRGWEALEWDKLAATIRRLQQRGIPNVVLVGQLPVFEVRQPNVGAKVFEANRVDRSRRGVDPACALVNERVKALARAVDVAFVSPTDLLCDTGGCLISTSRTTLVPLAWDEAHLTEAGATLLVELALRRGMLSLPAP